MKYLVKFRTPLLGKRNRGDFFEVSELNAIEKKYLKHAIDAGYCVSVSKEVKKEVETIVPEPVEPKEKQKK